MPLLSLILSDCPIIADCARCCVLLQVLDLTTNRLRELEPRLLALTGASVNHCYDTAVYRARMSS